MNKVSAKTRILMRLAEVGAPIAVHDLHINGVSENSAATRLSELQASGLVVGEDRPGKSYKLWRLAKDGEVVKIARKTKPIPAAVVGVDDTYPDGFKRLTVSVPPALEGQRISWRVEAVAV